MGILKRVVDMTRAAANEVLDKIENPETMLNHYLRDMDEEIAKTERLIENQKVQEKIMTAKAQDAQAEIDHYSEKAATAVAEGRETDARVALEAKLVYAENMNENHRLKDLAAQAVAELEVQLEVMKEERIKMQNKRAELVTRINQTGNHPKSPGHHVHHNEAARGFDRIEQRVMEWEARSELARTASPYSSASSLSSPATAQQELRNAKVEEELQRLLNKK